MAEIQHGIFSIVEIKGVFILGLLDGITNFFNRGHPNGTAYAHMLEGKTPVFRQYGNDIYKSDVVKQAISRIATEMSKLQPRHIRITPDGLMTTPQSQLNRLFKNSPNELMTTRDYIERITWGLFLNYNVFIYPMYELQRDSNGIISRYYTGLYPLQPINVVFLQDESNTLFIEMTFASGDKVTLKYSDIIHIRHQYSVNTFMGGNEYGHPDTETMRETVQINHDLFNSVAAAVKYALKITGILKVNTQLDPDKQEKERQRFETMIRSGESGILLGDLKGDYTNIKSDPKLIDEPTLKFIDSKILRNYNVSLAILNGDFTAEQYQAFYEAALETLIIAYGQAHTKGLMTQGQIDFGNEVVFYPAKLIFANTAQKTAIADILGNRGAITNNMLLEMFGYPPYDGGDVRMQSLNFVDVNIANLYQLKTVKGENKNEK